MAFGEAHQHGHMMSGVQAAMKSPKTPAHLKAHLARRMEANMFGKPKAMPMAKAILASGNAGLQPGQSGMMNDMDGDEPMPFVKPKGKPFSKKNPFGKQKKKLPPKPAPSAFYGE